MYSLRASPVFSLVVLVSVGFFGFIGVVLFGGGLIPAIAAMGHFSSLSHRIHDFTYALLFGTGAVGMLAQLRTPLKNVAGQLMALVPWVSFVLAFALGNILFLLIRPPFVPVFGALALLATILHPTWRGLFSSFSVSRVNWVMLALATIAAAPLLAFAATNIALQTTVADDHAAVGHYGYMAAFSLTVIGVALLASLRPDGWWLSAWVAGFLPGLLGLVSLLYPGVSSSLGLVWALAAIAWGVVFVVAAELTQDIESPTLLGWLRSSRDVISKGDTGMGPEGEPTISTPRGVKVLGIIALVPILLVIVIMVASAVGAGGAGDHTPAGGQSPPIQHGP